MTQWASEHSAVGKTTEVSPGGICVVGSAAATVAVVAELLWLQYIPQTFQHCSCRRSKKPGKKADSKKGEVGSPKNPCEKVAEKLIEIRNGRNERKGKKVNEYCK